MRIPLTQYGLPQLVVYPVLVLVVMVLLFIFIKPLYFLVPIEVILFLVFLWMLSFFRDPHREIIPDAMVLYSPADGTITDIEELTDSELGVPALKIGMFLSIFNVHINRAPCSVRIEKITYKKGMFKNAMASDSGKVNESNDILMTPLSRPNDRLLVRQVSGAIARHIVCKAQAGDEYSQGAAFGMIKFGSRTELYVPSSKDGAYEVKVKIGDPVRAGLTPLIRYNQ